MNSEKIRTIITQDAEVDDQNSLRHFLLYANEVELQGIVQTSSKFHWAGIPGAVRPVRKRTEFEFEAGPDDYEAPFDEKYRWPGTDWMFRVIDDYEKDYPGLKEKAEGFPTPDYLRSITKIGNIGYEGEMEHSTEGSELIRGRILDDDPRTLYIQVWGGTNTVARALKDIEEEYAGSEGWEALHEKITKKVVMTACGEQDPTYRSYIAESWPGMQFVKTLQMGSYAYPWFMMPEGESKDTLRAPFMKPEILNGKSALTDGYCTWFDGKYYEGEGENAQFGANPDIIKSGWMKDMGIQPVKYDFLSEGDSPTFFLMFDFGFRTLENFAYGGIAGRYALVKNQFNSKGEALNVWDVEKDAYTDRDGNTAETESMWPYVADIQRSFASRADWCAGGSDAAEYAPLLSITEGTDLTAEPGEVIELHAEAGLRPGDGASLVRVSWKLYKEASAACAKKAEFSAIGEKVSFMVPADAKKGDQIHLVVQAKADGKHQLTYYQQVIVTVK